MDGFFRATGDLLVTCRCGYTGWVRAIEDYQRMSLTWSCPECEHEEEEDFRDDES